MVASILANWAVLAYLSYRVYKVNIFFAHTILMLKSSEEDIRKLINDIASLRKDKVYLVNHIVKVEILNNELRKDFDSLKDQVSKNKVKKTHDSAGTGLNKAGIRKTYHTLSNDVNRW